MARRRYFTLDQALAQVLDKEDDFLFGAVDSESDGEGGESLQSTEGVRSSSGSAECRSADLSGEVDLAMDDPASSDDSPAHFLDSQADAGAAAQRFCSAVDEERDESGGGGDSAGAETTGSTPPSASQLTRCGCDQQCVHFYDAGEIEAHRLSVLDLAKTEKEALVVGVLESCRYADGHTMKSSAAVVLYMDSLNFELRTMSYASFTFENHIEIP